MSSSEVDPALVTALKRLRLGRIAATLRERLLLAEKQSMGHEEMLLMLLTDEIARREASATESRVRDAGLDPGMRLELWDKTAKVSFDRRLLGGFTSLRFLEEHKHIVILGSVGVGKTFLANALGHLACQHGYSVRFLRADAMLRRLRQSRLDNSRDAEMVALTTVDLLILDDFALEAMSKEASRPPIHAASGDDRCGPGEDVDPGAAPLTPSLHPARLAHPRQRGRERRRGRGGRSCS